METKIHRESLGNQATSCRNQSKISNTVLVAEGLGGVEDENVTRGGYHKVTQRVGKTGPGTLQWQGC